MDGLDNDAATGADRTGKAGTGSAGTGVARRGFLGVLATMSASAAALTAAGTGSAAAQETPEEMVRTRYQETEHVLTFYQTNRYE